ncbi:MAG: hypothetical protein ORN51_12315 [Akkermansiaceae bacterium]|nr:hypothetical protein [Akkermansiaceae bacterium]
MNHSFTPNIIEQIESEFPTMGKTIFELSPLFQYINKKTRSANRGSKSRSSFANLYALYVLIEDYIAKSFPTSGAYSDYEGADFSPLLARMRELPFGSKLQNHALNSRANDEFHKYFPEDERRPILRNVATRKYWINEALLVVAIGNISYNLADCILNTINLYVTTKRESFSQFIDDCEKLKKASEEGDGTASDFVRSLIAPERDARLFEIASYSILKAHYVDEIIFIGWQRDAIREEPLCLYKTGRTNANDGGIDFVMTPLGRFFQVTETLDVKKYFLDIDKIEKFPISFVIKTLMDVSEIRARLELGALEQYGVRDVVNKYMNAIDEIITIPRLLEIFDALVTKGRTAEVLDEIIRWSKVEFNIDDQGVSVDSVADEDEDADEE